MTEVVLTAAAVAAYVFGAFFTAGIEGGMSLASGKKPKPLRTIMGGMVFWPVVLAILLGMAFGAWMVDHD